jgi:NTE family protein
MTRVQDNSMLGKSEPGQVVLVLQGGGALGSYQAGVYQALHEAGIEPDWIIGTSIGAINASLIAGNAPQNRLSRLREFWKKMEQNPVWNFRDIFPGFNEKLSYWSTVTNGIPGFFRPNPLAHAGDSYPLGPDQAGYYSTSPLEKTLTELVDFDLVNQCTPRLTVGAAHVRSSQCATSTAATANSASSTSWHLARFRRHFRRCASMANCTGTAAFSRTRRRRPCSTTTRAGIR